MRGNSQARFLGGLGLATAPGYPTYMDKMQEQLNLDDQSYGKLKLFNRILISYNDFKQAHEIASLLIDGNLYKNYPQENRHLVIALNMAVIVAYSRSFLDSKGELAHNRLPGKVLKILNRKEMEVHETVLKDRNTMMAHSDADANETIPVIMEVDNKSFVIPQNASPHATVLLPEAMQVLYDMSFKLQEYCYKLRTEMEPEMLSILPRMNIEEDIA